MPISEKSPKTRAVIIDDDLPSVQILSRALEERGDVELAGTANSLKEGTELVNETCPDIIFLDMAFPESNGLEWYASAHLPANTKVVFYTCYQRYIHDALSLKVFDFLLKPFDPSELDIVMKRYHSQSKEVCPPASVALLSKGMKPLAITSVTNAKVIANPSDILYFRYQSDRKLWECIFTDLKRFILKRQTTAEAILGYGSDFVRTHKKFIVNIRYVGMISGEDCMLLPPFDQVTEIKISKLYKRELMDNFYDI